MRFFATIENQTYEVVIEGDQMLIDGVQVEADMQRTGQQDLYSLLMDHASHEVVVEPDGLQRGQYGVLIAGTRYNVKVQDERARRLVVAERRAQQGGGDVALRAPIPGLVVSLSVLQGQRVDEGEPVLILEAMKMENELRAPVAGTVQEVRAQAGAQVATGQMLLSIRPKGA